MLCLQRMPPDIARVIISKLPTASRCAAAASCRALRDATTDVTPVDVDVPSRALQRASTVNPRYWASFISWVLRHSSSLENLRLVAVLCASLDVDVLFDWLSRIVALCPGLSSQPGSCILRLHISGMPLEIFGHSCRVLYIRVPAVVCFKTCIKYFCNTWILQMALCIVIKTTISNL